MSIRNKTFVEMLKNRVGELYEKYHGPQNTQFGREDHTRAWKDVGN